MYSSWTGFFVALSLTSKTVKLYPIEGNREAYSKVATNPAPTKYLSLTERYG